MPVMRQVGGAEQELSSVSEGQMVLCATHAKLQRTLCLAGHALCDACLQLCEGIAWIHANRHVHGDVTPQNALLKGERVKVSDMGQGKQLHEDHSSLHSLTCLGARGRDFRGRQQGMYAAASCMQRVNIFYTCDAQKAQRGTKP